MLREGVMRLIRPCPLLRDVGVAYSCHTLRGVAVHGLF